MSTHKANPFHEVLYLDLCALVNKHTKQVPAIEILAVAANMLGKLIAMQDQREMTPEMAMKIVALNIELGNKQVVEQLAQTKGTPQ